MEAYLTKPVKRYYYLLIGHKSKPFIHPRLFLPRCEAVDREGNKVYAGEKNYVKSFVLDEYQILEKLVSSWASNNTALTQIPQIEKNIINSIKVFMNHDDFRVCASFHDNPCDELNQFAMGNHLHMILETTLEIVYNHSAYRGEYSNMKKYGGYCTLKHIRGDVMGFMHYLTKDKKKVFLGSNSQELLTMYNNSLQDTAALLQWHLEDAENPDNKPRSADSVPWEYDTVTDSGLPAYARSSGSKTHDTDNENPFNDGPSPTVPVHLRRDNAAQSVKFMTELIRKYPRARDINQLIGQLGSESEEFSALCHAASTPAGRTSFTIALNQIMMEMNSKHPAQLIQELPEKIAHTMTIKHSQAMFNAWAIHQKISPRKYTCIMRLLLSGAGQKRIGVYLQGAPNSGKTVLTNTLWTPIKDLVGRLTKDNFIFQDCGGKRIVIGEEIAITKANVERFKDLMSGAVLKCERKCTTPVDCNPSMVMMNSNSVYRKELDRQQIAALSVRLYNFEGLRSFNLMKRMYNNLHPRLFFENVPEPTDDEIEALRTNTTEMFDMSPIGFGQVFTGSWSEIDHTEEDNMDLNVKTPDNMYTEVHAMSSDEDLTAYETETVGPRSPDTDEEEAAKEAERQERELEMEKEMRKTPERTPPHSPPPAPKKASKGKGKMVKINPKQLNFDACFSGQKRPVAETTSDMIAKKTKKVSDILPMPECAYYDVLFSSSEVGAEAECVNMFGDFSPNDPYPKNNEKDGTDLYPKAYQELHTAFKRRVFRSLDDDEGIDVRETNNVDIMSQMAQSRAYNGRFSLVKTLNKGLDMLTDYVYGNVLATYSPFPYRYELMFNQNVNAKIQALQESVRRSNELWIGQPTHDVLLPTKDDFQFVRAYAPRSVSGYSKMPSIAYLKHKNVIDNDCSTYITIRSFYAPFTFMRLRVPTIAWLDSVPIRQINFVPTRHLIYSATFTECMPMTIPTRLTGSDIDPDLAAFKILNYAQTVALMYNKCQQIMLPPFNLEEYLMKLDSEMISQRQVVGEGSVDDLDIHKRFYKLRQHILTYVRQDL